MPSVEVVCASCHYANRPGTKFCGGCGTPERAVLCALAMQAGVESVAEPVRRQWNVHPAIRIGVNTGHVVAGNWDTPGTRQVAVTGDPVNTAARIQSVAEPGEILVGNETKQLRIRATQCSSGGISTTRRPKTHRPDGRGSRRQQFATNIP